jgi:hypothetical protein
MPASSKKRSLLRKILKYAVLSLGILILLLFLLPILFRPQIIAFAKKQLNKQLTAKVDFEDVRISLFRNFPRLDLKFENLTIAGSEGFLNDTLLIAPAAHVVTNFKTLFRSDVEVYAIELDEPDIRARVDSSGRQNFDIMKRTASATDDKDTSAVDFSLALRRYEINNGKLSYYDDQARVYTEMKNFNHQGSGDFTDVRFKMDTETKADSVNFRFGGLSYLSGAVVDLPVELDIDNGNLVYVFSSEEFFINSVPLASSGTIKSLNDSVDNVDITVRTKRSEFKNILTLIPGVYTQNLDEFETRGTAVIDGRIYGNSGPQQNPDFNIKIDVADGYVKNPQFPEAISGIHLDGRIVNTGGVNDSTVITMKNGRANVGSEPLQFELEISRPVTAMFINLAAKGNLQLEKLKSILKTGSTDIRGNLNADVRASGPLQSFREKEADAIRASGYLNAHNFYYKDPSTLPFTAGELKMQFDRSEANLVVNNGSYNNTSINATGTIFNFFNFLFVNSPLRGKISASSPEVNLAHWASSNTSSTAPQAASKPFIVPASLMLDINAHANKLITERVTLSDVDGRILFGDRKLLMENVRARGFGGEMEVDGSYSSEKTPLQPDITLNYKIRNFDVRQTFKAFVTAKSLMPIGEYLSGTLSSELSAAGKLGDDFMPIMNSLNGNGNLLLLNGLLEKFKPLEKIAERLDIDRLRNIATKEIRNRFSFENGLVNVLPFKFTIFENYDFEVAGKHGFDNSMDYAVKLSLPRKDLGAKGQLLYQTLNAQLGKIGLDIKPSEKVSFFIRLTGTLISPNVDIQLDKTLGNEFDILKEQAEEQIKTKLDSAKNVVKDSLKKIKDQIITGIKDKILGKDTSEQKPKDSSSKKKQVIKSVIDIFTNRNKKDSLD